MVHQFSSGTTYIIPKLTLQYILLCDNISDVYTMFDEFGIDFFLTKIC